MFCFLTKNILFTFYLLSGINIACAIMKTNKTTKIWISDMDIPHYCMAYNMVCPLSYSICDLLEALYTPFRIILPCRLLLAKWLATITNKCNRERNKSKVKSDLLCVGVSLTYWYNPYYCTWSYKKTPQLLPNEKQK